jgi:proton glutamate symport protein
MIGLVIGLIVGYIISITDRSVAAYIRPFSQIFIRMIQMIIAPLLFGTLVAGIAGAGHFKDVGRMGLRAIIYFEVVTTLALFIGLAAVNIMQPGVGVVLPADSAAPGVATTAQTWDQILLHLVPTSIIEAMATGDILQIVVFSIVFAIGLGMVGEKARPMIEWCESLTEAMFKVTNIVMLYAPIGVGAAIAYTIGVSGMSVLRNLAFMIFTLYLALAAFFLLVLIR